MDKQTKKQQNIIDGKEHPDSDYTKNDNGSVTFDKGILTYEQFHEALNNLFNNHKLTILNGVHQDFVFIKRKLTIKI